MRSIVERYQKFQAETTFLICVLYASALICFIGIVASYYKKKYQEEVPEEEKLGFLPEFPEPDLVGVKHAPLTKIVVKEKKKKVDYVKEKISSTTFMIKQKKLEAAKKRENTKPPVIPKSNAQTPVTDRVKVDSPYGYQNNLHPLHHPHLPKTKKHGHNHGHNHGHAHHVDDSDDHSNYTLSTYNETARIATDGKTGKTSKKLKKREKGSAEIIQDVQKKKDAIKVQHYMGDLLNPPIM